MAFWEVIVLHLARLIGCGYQLQRLRKWRSRHRIAASSSNVHPPLVISMIGSVGKESLILVATRQCYQLRVTAMSHSVLVSEEAIAYMSLC
jgi:hypothetical protein